jgi:Bacteriocin-protection, YdeI or OmpD-Associated/Domain of unknown function (DUF1905)
MVQRFSARVEAGPTSGFVLTLDFDPVAAWGRRDVYRVNGTIAGAPFRGVITREGAAWVTTLGPKSQASSRASAGAIVEVAVDLEGPQAEALAPDIAAALANRPRARLAFDELATFYRKGWLRWIDATKRRPDERARRIDEMVRLVEAGHKELPR